MQMELLRIFNVDFTIIDELLLRFFAYIRYWRKMEVQSNNTPAIPRF
jgi:hypothetical protein